MASFGLTIRRIGWAPRREQFFNLLVVGLRDVLVTAGHSLIVRIVEDSAEAGEVLRHWVETGSVQAVIIYDRTVDDEGLESIRALGLPFVLLGNRSQRSWHQATVTEDDGALMQQVLDYLVSLGHQHVVWVSGPVDQVGTAARRTVFDAYLASHGLTGEVYPGDYVEARATGVVESVQAQGRTPMAIIFDGEYLAVTAQRLLAQRGLDSEKVALLTWQDSAACLSATPPLTALNHHVDELGRQLGKALIALHEGATEAHFEAPAADLVVRGTTPRL